MIPLSNKISIKEDVFEILMNRNAYDMNVYPDEESMEESEYRERDSRLPPPGTRVRRGPNWHYNNQDSNGPGTVIGNWSRDGWIYVEWDTGMKFPYEYDTENVNSGDIVITDEPRLLQRESIAVGCLVQSGPDWQWENQDGGPGNIGTVYRVKQDVVYLEEGHNDILASPHLQSGDGDSGPL
ncbi:uncharacterized protein LOC133178076 [Saccostrea echinata]|uniref:uncharacterized protein LOC133178076 n=1 Tax=Saccostrea echinata TaxID=191078 RepID=UPI002A8173E7|nr:uncharacterized protein LOC133178076 [Saccostrea echinata]